MKAALSRPNASVDVNSVHHSDTKMLQLKLMYRSRTSINSLAC